MDSAIACDYWKDLVRERVDGEQVQATPMTLELLETMASALQAEPSATRRVAPRLRRLAEHAQQRRRQRDSALLHVAYDLLMRASELVVMPWDRIESLARGGGTYRFGRTKTDQAGAGRTLYLRPETMAALQAWRDVAPIGDYVFHAVDDDLHLDPSAAADAGEAARLTARLTRATNAKRRHLAGARSATSSAARRRWPGWTRRRSGSRAIRHAWAPLRTWYEPDPPRPRSRLLAGGGASACQFVTPSVSSPRTRERTASVAWPPCAAAPNDRGEQRPRVTDLKTRFRGAPSSAVIVQLLALTR